MDTITITLSREELTLIKDALNTYAVYLSKRSKTVGVDYLHPDFWHRLWNDTSALWCKVFVAIYPETEKED